MIYWDIYHALSYNNFLHFIIGARGCGKTYGFKYWAIKDFLKTGKQFIYVRRYKDEMRQKQKTKFFDDIKSAFPEHTFAYKNECYMIDGKEAGYPIILSTQKVQKSIPYPNVNKICFDEFIIDKGVYHYIPDEVTNFLELCSTVIRTRNDVRIFMLSNALTIINPYFTYFNIEIPKNKNIISRDDIYVEMVHNPDFVETMENTRFGKLIKNTEYGDYAIGNNFYRDNDNFIEKKSPKSMYYFTLIYNGQKFGVWKDIHQGKIYITSKTCDSITIALTTDDHSPNTLFLKGSRSVYLQNLLVWYRYGVVRFENQKVKGAIYNAFALMMR